MANAVFYLMEPTSIAYTGTSATISANGSVEFSACSVLSLNGVFSADYDNYTVVMRASASAPTNLYFRLRASGNDNSTASSYTAQGLEASGTTVGGGRGASDTAVISGLYPTQRDGVIVQIYGPFLSQPTAARTINALGYLNAYMYEVALTHNQSSSYDGFSLYVASGLTFTGRVAVYGMRK